VFMGAHRGTREQAAKAATAGVAAIRQATDTLMTYGLETSLQQPPR
jgi:hypothetical protein